jgi:L-alanine-DL-glutamate epimerase-like enolase superfamily enzyme
MPLHRIARVDARAYRIPTDAPEADGTIAWDATTLVVVEIEADGRSGLGYTYASAAAAAVVGETLARILVGEDCFAIPRLWAAMVAAVRNLGWRGVCANAISAVDTAAAASPATTTPGSRISSGAGSRARAAASSR